MTLQSLTLEGEQVEEFHWLPEDELAQIDEDSLKVNNYLISHE